MLLSPKNKVDFYKLPLKAIIKSTNIMGVVNARVQNANVRVNVFFLINFSVRNE